MNLASEEKGATLLEGLAFLAIAVVVALAAMSMWTTATNTASAYQSRQEILSLTQDVKQLYKGAGGFAGLRTPDAIQAGLIPSTLAVTGHRIQNEWGGRVFVRAINHNSQFRIRYERVPRNQCMRLAVINGEFDRVYINDRRVGGRVSLKEAAKGCDRDHNRIDFVTS